MAVLAVQPRRCRELKYASQSEASHWRAQRKAVSIRHRLGANGDTLDGPFPPKPPKMRWALEVTRIDAMFNARIGERFSCPERQQLCLHVAKIRRTGKAYGEMVSRHGDRNLGAARHAPR